NCMNDARRSTGIAFVNSVMRLRSFSERCFLSSARKSSNGMGVHLAWLHFATRNTPLQTLLTHLPRAFVACGRIRRRQKQSTSRPVSSLWSLFGPGHRDLEALGLLDDRLRLRLAEVAMPERMPDAVAAFDLDNGALQTAVLALTPSRVLD